MLSAATIQSNEGIFSDVSIKINIDVAMTMLAMARGSEDRREDEAATEAEAEAEANGEVDVVGVEEAAPVDLTRRLGLTRPPDRPAIAFSVENILDPNKFTGRSDVSLRYEDHYWRPHYDRDDSDSGKFNLPPYSPLIREALVLALQSTFKVSKIIIYITSSSIFTMLQDK